MSARQALLFSLLFVVAATGARAQVPADLVGSLETQSGLFDLHLDREAGKAWLTIPLAGPEFLYLSLIHI